jgi:type II secretory pathway pseudopilin PulG
METSLSSKFSSSIQACTAKQRERRRGPVRRSLGEGGFTLLELLVVITIIIILIGFLFPAFRGIQDQAKRTQAKNDLNQIVTAISAFYTEYGYYPVPSGTNTDTSATYGTTNPNNLVFDVLRYDTNLGDSATVQALNPRQVVFIEPPIAKDQQTPKLGLCYSGTCGPKGGWFDPWGYQYQITIDANYNAVSIGPAYTDLAATYTTSSDSVKDVGPKTGAIAWTFGADDKIGNNGDGYYKDKDSGVQSDDVVSWQ